MTAPKTARRMDVKVPLGSSPAEVRQRIEAMEVLLERAVTIPVLRRKVGLDAILGLIPFAGDLLTAAMGAYAVWEARNLGLPRWKQWRMIANIGVDTAIGAIPLAGDLFDFLYRSNTRNLKIIRAHLDKHHPETRVIEG
ncbi:DUF4112 domain-containing protein [Novosphingobium sp. MW5]|nr:DUF4112 domain-containing protein [Novosphingobium sp. MW5]